MRKDYIIDRVTIERKKEVFNAHTTHPASSDANNATCIICSRFFLFEDPKNPSETSEKKIDHLRCSVLLSSRASLVVVLIVWKRWWRIVAIISSSRRSVSAPSSSHYSRRKRMPSRGNVPPVKQSPRNSKKLWTKKTSKETTSTCEVAWILKANDTGS